MIRAGQRRKFVRVAANSGGGGAFAFPLLYLPLNDLGAGAVNTVPAIAAGSAVATFTRASANNYCKLASGLWAPVATGIARAHYLGRDTAAGAYGGYLSEPAGVQLVTPTAAIRDMSNAAWVAVGITPTLTATGIDGVPNACSTLTATAPSGTIIATLIAAATARTYSAFVRRKTGSGTILLKQGTATLDITGLINSVTYTRVQLNDSELNVAYGFQINTSGDAIDVDFNQFEALAATQFATSPMATTGAARAADVLSYVAAGNVDFAQGTAYAELTTNYTVAPASLVALAFGGNAARVLYLPGAASTTISTNDGTNVVGKGGLTDMSTAVRKRANSWGGSGLSITGDGAVPATIAFDGVMGTTPIEVGCSGGLTQWNGTEKEIRLFPLQFTSAQMQAISA